MKKLIIIFAIMLAGVPLHAQRYYYKAPKDKLVSYQVGVHAVSYGEDLMYGFHLGGNFGEVLDITYFLVRDYTPETETLMDTKWAGLNATLMVPITDVFEVGPLVRMTRFKGERENKLFLGAETRFDLNRNIKVAFFYGKGERTGTGLKLIWNLY